jgi:hypothetical protein
MGDDFLQPYFLVKGRSTAAKNMAKLVNILLVFNTFFLDRSQSTVVKSMGELKKIF